MTHLTDEQQIDALDGALSSEAQAHLADCAECLRQHEALSFALQNTQQIGVPEPSPLFWSHLSARVSAALDAEGAPQSGSSWWRWPVLAPIAGLALIVFALVVALPRAPVPLPIEIAESADRDLSSSDDTWMLMADVLADIDWETATAAGLTVEPGAADRAAMDLSVDEQRELTALLKAELQRTKS